AASVSRSAAWDRRESRSVSPGAAVLHADVGPFADAVQGGLVHRGSAPIVHADVDRIAAAVGLDAVLDRVAGHGATGGTCRDRDVAATIAVGVAARQLLGGNRADDATQDRAGDIGAAVAGSGLDRHHGAAVETAAGRRRRGRRTIAGAVSRGGAG